MQPFFENLVECLTEELFLQEFSRKYHYDSEQMALLKEVSFAMQKSILHDNRAGKAGWKAICHWSGRKTGKYSEKLHERQTEESPEAYLVSVCMTLGPGVDALQEEYLAGGFLTEAYMIETLGSELLLKAYPQWNDWVAHKQFPTEDSPERDAADLVPGSYRVRRYHFLGSEEQYPIEALPNILEQLRVPVTCTQAYCMIPKKSVAFYAELVNAGSAADGDIFSCEGICAGCHSTNCPNRMEKQHTGSYDTDMTDRPFTYGYSRIFGLR